MIGSEPPAMRDDDVDADTIERICDDLADHVFCLAATAASGHHPWKNVSSRLIDGRRVLEKLVELYNDFERDIEKRYSTEILESYEQ